MLSEAEKKRLAELYNAGYERLFADSINAQVTRRELDEFLTTLHQRECPHQPFREFKQGCYRMAKEWLQANDPRYPSLR